MPNLQSTISNLAEHFVRGVLEALRQAPLAEILAETVSSGRPRQPEARAVERAARGGGSPRRPRRGGDVDQVLTQIVTALTEAGGGGLRSEELRKRLGLARADLTRALGKALAAGQVRKTGEKRATTYFAGSSRGSATAAVVSKAPKRRERAKKASQKARTAT